MPPETTAPEAPLAHVRVVGPHGHRWREVGREPLRDVTYRECRICGARSHVGTLSPNRRDWLAGGPWDREEGA